jgi:hypothetical protein
MRFSQTKTLSAFGYCFIDPSSFLENKRAVSTFEQKIESAVLKAFQSNGSEM